MLNVNGEHRKHSNAEVFNRGSAEVLHGGRESFGWLDIFFILPPAIFCKNWNIQIEIYNIWKYTLTWIQHTSRVYMDTYDPISNQNRSIPIMRSECTIYMSFTTVVSVRSYVYRSHLTHLDWLRHFYVFDLSESPAGESFSMPAHSIKKKDSTATSVSRPVFISTPFSAANNTFFGVRSQDCWERECRYVKDNVQNAVHYRENKRSAEK